MSNKTAQNKANAVILLRQVQQRLAIEGYHTDALRLGRKIRAHTQKIAKDYLGIKIIPNGTNDFLIKELCIAFVSSGNASNRLRSRLRLAAWANDDTITKQLETAYEALPDLDKVREILK